MKQKLIKTAIAVGLFAAAFIYFIIVQVGFASILDTELDLEVYLFIDSLAKPVGLTAIGIWLLLMGKYLKLPKATSWGKRFFLLYAVAALAPYFLSFLITPQ